MSNDNNYNPVLWVNSSQNNDELSDRYNTWSATYDDDVSQDFDWNGPNIASDIFEKYVPKSSQILDAGAGTGLAGHLLKEKGYLDLTGMDLSQGMLSQAAKKNIYKELHKMVMGQPLSFPSNRFNATNKYRCYDSWTRSSGITGRTNQGDCTYGPHSIHFENRRL
jgi:ubiquinone/menaquinone biosynthesis C-methylase UbiE